MSKSLGDKRKDIQIKVEKLMATEDDFLIFRIPPAAMNPNTFKILHPTLEILQSENIRFLIMPDYVNLAVNSREQVLKELKQTIRIIEDTSTKEAPVKAAKSKLIVEP